MYVVRCFNRILIIFYFFALCKNGVKFRCIGFLTQSFNKYITYAKN